jgi:hypothetical protein
MRNRIVAVVFTATVAFVGAAAWKAEAVPLVTPAATPSTPIELASCRHPGPYCPWGRHRVCNRWGHHCRCARC